MARKKTGTHFLTDADPTIGCKQLTKEQVRKEPGFEHYTDEECDEYIAQIKELSFIFYRIYAARQERETNYLTNTPHDE
jgi:hypothetical protein